MRWNKSLLPKRIAIATKLRKTTTRPCLKLILEKEMLQATQQMVIQQNQNSLKLKFRNSKRMSVSVSQAKS
jgi:hypothetical protein